MSVLALKREHASIYKAPVLHSVDSRIFELRYFTHCMDCGFCNDQCCSYGVDIDAENAERLLALDDDFKAFIGVPESEWFTGELVEDAEFPSGRCRRTQVRGSHCVFHKKDGRGCLIHAWCLEKGLDYHTLKPMVSILFPVTFDYGVLGASGEAVDRSLVCAGSGPTLYDGVRGELEYYFGAALIAELDAMARPRSRQTM
ncbi:MAG TPA: hypothetical protein VG889_02810 [Rhizomicrobium sp.]|nr:hypothetical protein [Rhizomicrobium sp.]